MDLSILPGVIESYPNLQAHKAEITIENPLPTVLGKESLLTQCFSNLLGNAVKFVPKGVRPDVRIRTQIAHDHALRVAAENTWFRISIKDNGIGIPEQARGRVFGMFERLTGDYEGTGIGLAIVRKVVERMHGRISLESVPGEGTCFFLDLPPPIPFKGRGQQSCVEPTMPEAIALAAHLLQFGSGPNCVIQQTLRGLPGSAWVLHNLIAVV